MPTPAALVFATAVAFVPSLLSAQAMAPAAAAPFSWPAATVLAETAADGVVHAAAPGWKAAFAANGATFTPFLGSTVPSRSARFRLASVWAGGAEVSLADAAPALRDRRVGYDRGGAVEFFDLREDGVEHWFELPALPSRGELRLQITVDTELLAARDGDGHVFSCADGGIRYGAAFAIDAAGNRLPLATGWTGGALQIVVPAAFVATAELPLRIDPLIGSTTALPASAVELSSTDVAFDASLGRWYVTWERAFSATDHDVYVALFDAAMAHVSTLTIDFTSAYWSKPRIATLEQHDVACVVAETSTANASPFALAWRRITGGLTPTVTAVVQVAGANGVDRRDPAIGGDAADAASSGGHSKFLIATTIDNLATGTSTIRLESLTYAGTFSSLTFLTVPGARDHHAAISKTCGTLDVFTDCWAVVFRREVPGAPTGTLQAAIVARIGPSTRSFQGQSSFPLTAPTTNFGSQWAVSSPTDLALGRRFLCAERIYDPIGLRGTIRGHVFDRDGNVIATGTTLASNASTDFRQPAAECDGARFVVACSAHLGASDADVYVRTYGLVGSQLVQHDFAAASYSLDYDGSPALCAARGSGPNAYGLGFVRRTAGTSWAVHAQLYRGVGAGGFVPRATGCGALGIQAAGAPALGESFSLLLSNNAGLPGFVVGVPVSLPIGPCPGCLQGVSGSTLLGPSLTIVVPPDAGLVGVTLAAQGFRFAPSGLPCLGQLEISDTIDFTIQ